MRLALTDLYRARWTDMIHDEWIRNVLRQRPDLKPEDLDRTRVLMNAHVRDSLVTGFEHLSPSVALPDADDRHVVRTSPKLSGRVTGKPGMGHDSRWSAAILSGSGTAVRPRTSISTNAA